MREKLSVRGIEVAKEFNWKNTANKLVNVLERVIEREAIKGEEKIHPLCDPESGECGGCDAHSLGVCSCRACHGERSEIDQAMEYFNQGQ